MEQKEDEGAGSLGVLLMREVSKQRTAPGRGSLPCAVCSG